MAQRLAAVGGFAVLAVALLPPLAGHGAPFVVHVVGHLLLAMVAAAIRSRAGRASSAPW